MDRHTVIKIGFSGPHFDGDAKTLQHFVGTLADDVVLGLDAQLTPHGVEVVRVPQAGTWAVEGDVFLLRRALGQAVDGRAIGRSGLSPHAAGAAAANDD